MLALSNPQMAHTLVVSHVPAFRYVRGICSLNLEENSQLGFLAVTPDPNHRDDATIESRMKRGEDEGWSRFELDEFSATSAPYYSFSYCFRPLAGSTRA